MRGLTLALLSAVLTLGGCAMSLSRVEFSEQKLSPASRFRTLQAEQRVCEVERQLALFSDENKHLWLSCPYRYEGRTIPLVAYVGPDMQRGAVEFTHQPATQKMKALRKETLRNCGASRYCADLSAYGYLDFTIQVAQHKARISYLDLSDGLKDVHQFYAQLEGTAAGTAPAPALDPQLVRLVDAARVVARIQHLGTLAQHRHAAAQLEALGLSKTGGIASTLEARGKVLTLAEFRQQGTFAGALAAYQLSVDAADLAQMQKLAESSEQKSAVFAALARLYGQARTADTLQAAGAFASTPQERAELAEMHKAAEQDRLAEVQRQEEARQAELRRQEAALLADARRQEEARLAELRAQQARADEERCMRNPACRQAVEERREQCVQKVQSCRKACDQATGAGSFSSFISNLAAAAMARTCYAGCKCDSAFGDLVAKFNLAAPAAATAPATTTQKPSASVVPPQSRPAAVLAAVPAPAAAAVPAAQAAVAAKPPPGAANGATAQVFECKVYCKSASGPTVLRRIEASTRKQAAKIASDQANEICAQQGHSHASSAVFSEQQCQAR